MKKYILIVLMAAMCLTACKTTKSVSKSKAAPAPAPAPAAAEQTANGGAEEKLSLGDIFRVIQEMEEATSTEPRDPKPVGEETTSKPAAPAAMTDFEKALAVAPQFNTAYGKGSFTLNYQQHKISLQGAITIQAGELIIVSVQVPIIGVEMMRVEIDHEKVMVLDKINKIYVLMRFEEVAERTGMPISFSEVEAIFMNHIFMLGTPASELPRLLTDNGNRVFTASQNGVNYRFTTNPDHQLVESSFTAGNKQATAAYSNHQQFGDIYFPMQITATLTGTSKDASIGVKLSYATFNTNVNTTRIDPVGYRQSDASTILGKLY